MNDIGLQFVPGGFQANRLVEDYLQGEKRVLNFYGGHFSAKGRLENLAECIGKSFDRARAAEIIAAQRTFPMVKDGKSTLRSFVDQGGFIVTTGQQPMLFGGPLFIIYKCITLVKLAERARELLRVPVLPVFWNASEDHDLAEVASISLPDLENRLQSLSFPGNIQSRRPLCQVEIEDGLEELFERLRQLTPQTQFRAWIFELLSSGYRRGQNLGHAFSEYLIRLFADQGLFVVDACHPDIRSRSLDLYEAEIFDARSSIRAVENTCSELKSFGYPLQIKPLPQDTNLFLIRHGVREKLQLGEKEGEFKLKHSGDKISAAELRKLLESYPLSFSSGVLMRPLVEAHLFGTLCYVAGPGEIGYYAQMQGLYKLRKLQMPVVYPRLSGILVESKIARVLRKYNLEAEQLSVGADELAGRLLADETLQRQALEETGNIRAFIQERLDGIMDLLREIDPTLSGPVKNTLISINTNLDRLERKITSAAKRRNQAMLSQLHKAALHLWPDAQASGGVGEA